MTPHPEGGAPLVATPSQTVGPFFHLALGPGAAISAVHPAASGRIALTVRITDGQGAPVPDAMVEIWQAPPPAGDRSGAEVEPCGFGRLPTGQSGECTFDTVRPGRATDGRGGWHAGHINVCLFARGLLRQLHTRLYFAGDPALGGDAVLDLVPADRRSTLLATPESGRTDRWLFHLRLQGPDETVFFDV